MNERLAGSDTFYIFGAAIIKYVGNSNSIFKTVSGTRFAFPFFEANLLVVITGSGEEDDACRYCSQNDKKILHLKFYLFFDKKNATEAREVANLGEESWFEQGFSKYRCLKFLNRKWQILMKNFMYVCNSQKFYIHAGKAD